MKCWKANSCLTENGCQSGCTSRSNGTSQSNGTSTSTTTAGSLSYPAKIGIITGGAVFGVCLILIGLYATWRCSRRRQKTIDVDTDFESDVASIADQAPAVIAIVSQEKRAIIAPAVLVIENQSINRVCKGCSQTKSIIADFPFRRITTSCNHEPGFCLQCLCKIINVTLTQGGWEQLRCPENACNARLEDTDVREFASLDDVQT